MQPSNGVDLLALVRVEDLQNFLLAGRGVSCRRSEDLVVTEIPAFHLNCLSSQPPVISERVYRVISDQIIEL